MEHFTGERVEIDAFGNGENTQAHCIIQVISKTTQTLKALINKFPN